MERQEKRQAARAAGLPAQDRFGLLGEKLGHSFSPEIHRALGGYAYELIELEKDQLGPFLREGAFRGLNVTIPYKQAVIPFLDRLDPLARMVGAVNTIVREPNGSLTGYNTDWAGFQALLARAGLNPRGKKCLVLGSGGAGSMAAACLRAEGASDVRIISRRGEENYENLTRHRDAALLINATPVGMFPREGKSPVSLDLFPALEGVADLIYHPLRTALLLQAQDRGLPWINGLFMLAEQARKACELFLGQPVSPEKSAEIAESLSRQTENLVLIGMPGCGKSTAGRLLAQKLAKSFIDTDTEIEKRAGGISCGNLIREQGEEAFRRLESEVIREAGSATGCVIATGGGAVTRPENRDPLRQNGRLIHLDRPLDTLQTDDSRPLSSSRASLEARYRERAPLYSLWRDTSVGGDSAEETVAQILRYLRAAATFSEGNLQR